MKNAKVKRFSIVLLIISMMFSIAYSSFSTALAVGSTAPTSIVDGKDATKYDFCPVDILNYTSSVGAGKDPNAPFIETDISQNAIDSNEVIPLTLDSDACDGTLNAADAANLYGFISGGDSMKIEEELKNKLNKDIELHLTLDLRETSDKIEYVIKGGKLQTTSGKVITDDDIIKNIIKILEYNEHVYGTKKYEDTYKEYGGNYGGDDWNDQFESLKKDDKYDFDVIKAEYNGEKDESYHIALEYMYFSIVSATAKVSDGSEYRLVIGSENGTDENGNKTDKYDKNWYMIRTVDPKFDTTMQYTQDSKTTDDDGKTFLPDYKDNDNNNKDLDVVVTIKSKTEEEIVKTNGVDLINEANKPNSEGWYYPDLSDKKVIAKKYLFDDYDNTTYNGKTKDEEEKVKLTGAKGGEDTQTPSIQWTFRRKNKEEKTNSDESVTVTITYNLPVDPDSIPSDWSPVYDDDGKTIHKITKTIKKGEDYDKDVTVKRNGDIDEKVTTHVEKKWKETPTEIPRAGGNIGAVIGVAIVLLGITVISYRKYKK